MLKAVLMIPGYRLFRLTGWPRWSPMNLTLSVSFSCNSRCRTCNVYTRSTQELSLEEWTKIFQSLKQAPFWVTISGGEPFLKKDIEALVGSLYDNCRPAIINIPTNGLLTERIPILVEQIARRCKQSQIVINLSIDEIGGRHDEIRGVPGNYAKALKTYAALKAIHAPNLTVGIHSVISSFNVQRVPQIYEYLRALHPDSYVTEIAEERVELNTVGAEITPGYSAYAFAVDSLMVRMRQDQFTRMGRIARAFRLEYYELVKKILKQKCQVIPCYAGIASAQIAPSGDVWTCCIKAESIGNLKEANYDFSKVWTSKKAWELRRRIKKKECFCPLANVGYTNMLHNFRTLLQVAGNLVKNGKSRQY